MLTEAQRRFVASVRVARLATVDARGRPHAVPVCFEIDGGSAYITIDRKPKSGAASRLQRLRNIQSQPAVALIVDRYHERWSELGWVLIRGDAQVLWQGAEHDRAQALLCRRYPQYRAMDLAPLPVIAIRIARVSAWGKLMPAADGETSPPSCG